MKDPRFRLYMERRMTTGSIEPNLHILGQPPFDPWPYVMPPTEPEEPKKKRCKKYRAVAHLCPGGLKGLLPGSDSDSLDQESECSEASKDGIPDDQDYAAIQEPDMTQEELEIMARSFIKQMKASLTKAQGDFDAMLTKICINNSGASSSLS